MSSGTLEWLYTEKEFSEEDLKRNDTLTSNRTIYSLLWVAEVLRQLDATWHISTWANEERWVKNHFKLHENARISGHNQQCPWGQSHEGANTADCNPVGNWRTGTNEAVSAHLQSIQIQFFKKWSR